MDAFSVEKGWGEKRKGWHRRIVGGRNESVWYQIGRSQFCRFILWGLKPTHRLLDVGCGSLRFGVHVIPYLDVGNYCGMDVSENIVRAGVLEELGPEVYEKKKPHLYTSSCFEMPKGGSFDVANAHSLFTHIHLDDIEVCVRNVMEVSPVLFATYNDATCKTNPSFGRNHFDPVYPQESYYRKGVLEKAVKDLGFNFIYHGRWGIAPNKWDHQLLIEIRR